MGDRSAAASRCPLPRGSATWAAHLSWARGAEVLSLVILPLLDGQGDRQYILHLLCFETCSALRQTARALKGRHSCLHFPIMRRLRKHYLGYSRSRSWCIAEANVQATLLDSKACFPASHWTKTWITWLTKEERASECPVDSHSGKSRICCVYID